MAPASVCDDYYKVLEVNPNASLEVIIKSYRRLALKLHPDRNAKYDATAAFQLLGQAYETLRDECSRRAYDLIYPTITSNHPSTNAPTSGGPTSSNAKSEAVSDAAQIAALQKSKQERNARWYMKQSTYSSSISKLQKDIQQIEVAIEGLIIIAAAEAAVEAQKNSWGTWILSPFTKKVEESEEEKARKDRERQQRMVERNLKERFVEAKKSDLNKEETLLRKAKEEKEAADRNDEYKIRVIQGRISTRERLEREAKMRAEQERFETMLRQQREEREKREREAAEALRKQRQEEAERSKKMREEEARRFQESFESFYGNWGQSPHSTHPKTDTRQRSRASCHHDGWWPKVQGRQTCPECSDSWTYLLQCPDCDAKACPKCQSVMRPRKPRGAARTRRATPSRPRTPSPGYWYGYD